MNFFPIIFSFHPLLLLLLRIRFYAVLNETAVMKSLYILILVYTRNSSMIGQLLYLSIDFEMIHLVIGIPQTDFHIRANII